VGGSSTFDIDKPLTVCLRGTNAREKRFRANPTSAGLSRSRTTRGLVRLLPIEDELMIDSELARKRAGAAFKKKEAHAEELSALQA
jgi:hypothetical protein